MKKPPQSNAARPPIVVVLGHVDHGKTTLLDFIRKANVAAREAGGITQSVGAYEIVHGGRKITFIDTPGHEAFTKIRSRGARVADIAVLVIAADDSIKPQTEESLRILREEKTPFVVAINKIDAPGADVEKVKTDLLQHDVLLEGFGGAVSWQAVSAKTGQGVSELLDLILLTADVEGLAAENMEDAGSGYVIESRMDRNRGIEATVILKNGVLRPGFGIMAGAATGKIKILEDFLGKRATELHPSSPAVIIGFATLPAIGEEFKAGASMEAQEPVAPTVKTGVPAGELVTEEPSGKPAINVILKADTAGSLEAFSGIVRAMETDAIKVNIVGESVGDVTDGDIRTAGDTGAIVMGFRSRVTKSAETLARAQNVRVITADIIYELTKKTEELLQSATAPAVLGELEVLALFSESGNKQVIGGKVTAGALKTNATADIVHAGEAVGRAKITNLQTGRKDVPTVESGKECGLMVQITDMRVRQGDVLRITE